ncbi:MAG: hypothetical protein SF172_08705 [Burkholderiales bacterium]|nr:hypothetical protein [Burkholderiales bacterium]
MAVIFAIGGQLIPIATMLTFGLLALFLMALHFLGTGAIAFIVGLDVKRSFSRSILWGAPLWVLWWFVTAYTELRVGHVPFPMPLLSGEFSKFPEKLTSVLGELPWFAAAYLAGMLCGLAYKAFTRKTS